MKRYAKQTALALAMALTVTSVAPATASAAAKPKYKKTYNAVKKGKAYAYTVKNIKKGTKVKWTIVGTGKKYVSFNKSKAVYKEYTKAAKKKTYSTNKVYIRKNTTKVVKAVVRATVTGKNGKKYTVNDKIAIAKATPTKTPVAPTAPTTNTPTAPATNTPTGTATTAPATEVPTPTVPVTEVPTGPATTAPATETPVTTATAVSAAAVNIRTIAVAFDRELTKEEQNAVKVTVTREKATQSVKTAFKDAKTLYITRDTDTAFAAATYNVELSGSVIAATYDVAVQAQAAKSVSINSSVLVDGLEKAPVKVSLLDQYGEEMTLAAADFTVIATNKTQNNADVASKLSVVDGAFVVNTLADAEAFKTNDQIQITLLHKTSGLSATATLKVVESTYVNKITLGNIELPTGTTRLTQNTKNVKVYYTAVNNYNEEVTLTDSDYTIASTNDAVLDTANVTPKVDTATKKTYFEISEFAGVGSATLVVLAKQTGETSRITLDVLENAGEVYAAEYATTSVEVAKGSTATIPVTLTDKYGDKVEAKNAVDAIKLTSSDEKVSATFNTTEGEDNYGKIVINAENADENSTAIITATVNGTPAVITVKVGKQAVPTTLAAKADTTALIAGSTATVTLDVKDQYSGSVTLKKDSELVKGDYYVKATVANNTDEVINAVVSDNKSVTITGVKAGTRSVKIDLMKQLGDAKAASDTVVDTKTVNFTVEANTTTNLTYAAKQVPTLYKNDSSATVASAKAAGYAQEVVVTAKKANGTIITLPANKILSVTSDSDNVIVEKIDNKWYVAGKDSTTPITADKAAKLTIVVATDDGSTIVTSDVTVSKDALQYKELKMYDSADAKTRKEISTLTMDAYTTETEIANLYKVDQFGVETAVTAADAVSLSSFSGFTNAIDDTAAFADGKLKITDTNGDTTAKAKSTFKATIVVGALTKTITVTVTAEKTV